MKKEWILFGGMVMTATVVAAAHWPVLSARALAFDDNEYVTENRLVLRPSWASAGRFFSEVLEPSTARGYYAPLTMISLMLDSAARSSKDDLQPFHRTNLALHMTNTLMVVGLVYMLFHHAWAALFAGLLFGLHPIATESIPWLSERKTMLATCFALASLLFYVAYAQKSGAGSFGASLALYVFALLAKPTTTPLPLAMMVLDWWPMGRGRRLLEKAPFLAIGAVSSVITFISQSRTAGATIPAEALPGREFLIVCHNLVFYLRNLLWPAGFPGYYPFPESMSLAEPDVLVGVVGAVVLIAALLISLRWTRAAMAGWLVFFLLILPTLGVIGFTEVIAANRFLYLPSIGLLLAFAGLIRWVWDRSYSQVIARNATRTMIVLVVLGLSAAEATAARGALSYWKDGVRLFEHYAETAPRSAKIRYNLGNSHVAQGSLDKAIIAYRQAIQLDPDYAEAHDNLAITLAERGQLSEAGVHFKEALRLQPDSPNIHNNLGVALSFQGRLEEATTHLREAVRLRPGFANAHFNLGRVLAQRNRHAEAIKAFQASLQINPDDVEVRTAFGQSLEAQGDFDGAVQQYQIVLRLVPNHTEAAKRLAGLRK